MSARSGLVVATLMLATVACDGASRNESRARSEAVSSASREMSGPSLFSKDALVPALAAVQARANGRALRLEIHPRELILQAEDAKAPGTVLEYHYADGKLADPEHATLRGKGELRDNLFDLGEVKLSELPALSNEAIRRIDAEEGAVDHVLIRRHLPESEEVRLRVYVSSPRQSGYLDADVHGRPL